MIALSFLYGIEIGLIGGVVFIGLSSTPDVDRHFDSSMNSRRSDILHYVPISHRGFTHTVWFAILAGVMSAGIVLLLGTTYTGDVVRVEALSAIGFLCGFGGVVGHIFGDMLTPTGVTPLSPVQKKTYSLNLCNAANTTVNYGLLLLGGGIFIATVAWSATEFGIATELA